MPPTLFSFLTKLNKVGGMGLYYHVELFNHPPFMIHMLQIMNVLTSTSGLPFFFWLRLPAILADVVSAFLLWKLLISQPATDVSASGLMLLAIAPASIMISGFHGNTDPLMICFVLVAVWLIDSGSNRVWLAGLAFGMSMNIKVLPVIFLPAIVLALPTIHKRIVFMLVAGATFVVGGLPFILQDPLFILVRLFGYGSNYGDWGISRILVAVASDNVTLAWLNLSFEASGKYILLMAVIVEALWMSRMRRKPSVFTQCGVVALTFMTLTPGFGVQYLAWLVPWVVAELWTALLYYATSGLFLFVTYTSWAKTFPWFVAIGSGSQGNVRYAEILCWLSVVILLVHQLWNVQRRAREVQ